MLNINAGPFSVELPGDNPKTTVWFLPFRQEDSFVLDALCMRVRKAESMAGREDDHPDVYRKMAETDRGVVAGRIVRMENVLTAGDSITDPAQIAEILAAVGDVTFGTIKNAMRVCVGMFEGKA